MMLNSRRWQNRSPGDLDHVLPEVTASNVEQAVTAATTAASEWKSLSVDERAKALRTCQISIRGNSESLARRISEETGKPLTEARGELNAAIAKFDLTIADAHRFIDDQPVEDGPHPALIRHRSRGPAAVVAPFNFPIHLGHGAAVAYLLAGNPVLFKPSPLAAVTGAEYGKAMASGLPPGIFQVVQGGGEIGRDVCLHPVVRSVCFTGSIPVGTALARELAADYSKSLALELGGKNASIVASDADVALAANAVADAMCLTAGQRCNATSQALVHESVLDDFLATLLPELERFIPGDPLDETTRLGPLISGAAIERYRSLTALDVGDWVMPGSAPGVAGGKRGHYVTPAAVLCRDFDRLAASPLHREESFCPILTIVPFAAEEDIARIFGSTPFGLTASIFTADRERFDRIGNALEIGNLYWNLPTTFSPSTLPFGGLGISGNGRPGGRGFIRFAADEQAVQWRKGD